MRSVALSDEKLFQDDTPNIWLSHRLRTLSDFFYLSSYVNYVNRTCECWPVKVDSPSQAYLSSINFVKDSWDSRFPPMCSLSACSHSKIWPVMFHWTLLIPLAPNNQTVFSPGPVKAKLETE